jgi:hypothetical protein
MVLFTTTWYEFNSTEEQGKARQVKSRPCPQNLGWLISSRFMLLLHSIPGRLPYGCLLFLYTRVD